MTARWIAVFVSLILAGIVPAARAQTAAGGEPLLGTWELNAAQSRIPQVPGMPKQQTEVYRDTGAGQIEMTLSRTTVDGAPYAITLAWPAEGGVADVRQGAAAPGDVFVETRVAPGEWWVTYLRDGRQYGTMHKVVSPDGRTLRQTFRGVVAGKPLELVGVFDRK